MPFKTVCSWTINLTNNNADLNLNFKSTGTAYIQVANTQKSTSKQITDHYTITQYSKLSLSLSGSYFELISYSYSHQFPITIQLTWTKKIAKKKANSVSSQTLIISVSCALVLTLIIFFTICLGLHLRRKAARVFTERTYQYILGDYSNNSFVDSIISAKYAINDLTDPCCICFDR